MRELKDYFCTYEQTQELMSLGLIGVEHLKHITPKNEILYQLSESCLGAILRSQALDFFRELGYKFTIHQNGKGHWYDIQTEDTIRIQPDWHKYHECESMLIDRLIELEKEARNGN